jgi:hypothetical protein
MGRFSGTRTESKSSHSLFNSAHCVLHRSSTQGLFLLSHSERQIIKIYDEGMLQFFSCILAARQSGCRDELFGIFSSFF